MKNKIKKITVIRAILLALITCVMVIIFALSAQAGEDSGETSAGFTAFVLNIFGINEDNTAPEKLQRIEGFVRTLAHFSEYAALGLLSTLFLRTYCIKRRWALCFAVSFSALYAVTDEIHQIFVPGRAAQFSDWLVDTSGALCGSLLVFALAFTAVCINKWRKKPRKLKNKKKLKKSR